MNADTENQNPPTNLSEGGLKKVACLWFQMLSFILSRFLKKIDFNVHHSSY